MTSPTAAEPVPPADEFLARAVVAWPLGAATPDTGADRTEGRLQVYNRAVQRQGDLAVEAWTEWAAFPDPRKKDFLYAPIGPGVYDLRRKDTGQLVLYGSGKNCAYRMTSLLPAPLGAGTRKNQGKRDYVMENLTQLEYRCCACDTEAEAQLVEARLKLEATYLFPT